MNNFTRERTFVVPLDGLEVRKAADSQLSFILLALVNHSVNVLRQDLLACTITD